MKIILQSIRLVLVLTILTGLAYPLAMTGLTSLLFPHQAVGSPIRHDGKIIGSELLAQKFESPRYFWPRPSAVDYATVASGASNLGPTSADLQKAIAERRKTFGPNAPADLLTASGSGLDPEISPAAARLQIPRVAQARSLPNERLLALVDRFTAQPQLNMFGEQRVRVLQLNLALDQSH